VSAGPYSDEVIALAIDHLDRGLALVPAHMRPGVRGYVLHGRPTGGFLQALLDGELALAVRMADDLNAAAFEAWRQVRRSYLPKECHGTREARVAWIEGGGLEGRRMGKGEA
jgi:hypothetical protein